MSKGDYSRQTSVLERIVLKNAGLSQVILQLKFNCGLLIQSFPGQFQSYVYYCSGDSFMFEVNSNHIYIYIYIYIY